MSRRKDSAEIVDLKGTGRADRPRDERKVTLLAGDPIRPTWLTGRARKIWDTKVGNYLARGQSVRGCEDALAQYCKLEADLIDKFWRKDITPPVSMVNAHRTYAHEFFDTPSSQLQPSGGNTPSNPFSRNGKPPRK